MQRREFLKVSASLATASVLPSLAIASPPLRGKAEHVILLWLPGGMGAIDTFDPKRKGNPQANQAGSYYDSISTAVKGVRVCEHLPRVASVMDRMTIIRSLHHDVVNEHAAATNFMHTGRAISGTVVYPSVGSVVTHELGSTNNYTPPYILVGYPNVTRGPGFLGDQFGYLYLIDTDQGPVGLSRPESISKSRQERRHSLLANLRSVQGQHSNARFSEYEKIIDQSLNFSGSEFISSFDLDTEPSDLRAAYGGGFGQRCLLARRLVERGVRFIEVSQNLNFVNGVGWDVHNEMIREQHVLIRELDAAVVSLVHDLEAKQLLDKTLVIIATEFGRPPDFDAGGGRGHQGSAFSCVLAGGGLNHCGFYGETDDFSKQVVSDHVSVPDFFATIYAAMGIDYTKSLYNGERPIPITDRGKPIARLFS